MDAIHNHTARTKIMLRKHPESNYHAWERATLLDLTAEHPRVIRAIKAGQIPAEDLAAPVMPPTTGMTAPQQLQASSLYAELKKEHEKREDERGKVFGKILARLSEQSLTLVTASTAYAAAEASLNPVQLMKVIKDSHLLSGKASSSWDRVAKLEDLQRTAMTHAPGEMGLVEYDRLFNERHQALIDVGGTIDEKELVRLYVNGLHRETFYFKLVELNTAIDNPSIFPSTLLDAQILISNVWEGIRRTNVPSVTPPTTTGTSVSEPTSEQVLVAARDRPKREKKPKNDKPSNDECSPSTAPPATRHARPQCKFCLRPGHATDDCKKLEDLNRARCAAPAEEQDVKKSTAKNFNGMATYATREAPSAWFMGLASTSDRKATILDSGASVHIVNDPRLIATKLPSEPNMDITSISGASMKTQGCGKTTFGPAYLLESAPFNIASLAELEDISEEITYHKGHFSVKISDKTYHFRRNGKLFELQSDVDPTTASRLPAQQAQRQQEVRRLEPAHEAQPTCLSNLSEGYTHTKEPTNADIPSTKRDAETSPQHHRGANPTAATALDADPSLEATRDCRGAPADAIKTPLDHRGAGTNTIANDAREKDAISAEVARLIAQRAWTVPTRIKKGSKVLSSTMTISKHSCGNSTYLQASLSVMQRGTVRKLPAAPPPAPGPIRATAQIPDPGGLVSLRRRILVRIRPDIAEVIARLDPKAAQHRRRDGSLVVLLRKALNGMQESDESRYENIALFLLSSGFSAIHEASHSFAMTSQDGLTTAVIRDDRITVAANSEEDLQACIKNFEREYKAIRFNKPND
jgi:hypothetical protein